MSPLRDRTARRRAVVASLSAAGAALAAGGEARADIIVTDVNENIGFAAGDLPTASFPLPGGNGISVYNIGSSFFHGIQLAAGTVRGTTHAGFGVPVRASAGQTYNNAGGSPRGSVNDIDLQTRSGFFAQGTFTDKYFLFTFNNAGTTDYGYIYGSETDSSFNGLTYNLISYAYDNTGAPIVAGAVPEPSSVALLGLGALAAGAAGVRRWKAAKAAPATATA